MVKSFSRQALLFGAALCAVNCNMEVGNPESELAQIGRAQSAIQSLDFQLAAKQPCSTIAADCTAVPITLADAADVAYTFEMTAAHLQLNAMELKPYSAESIITRLDLMAGTQVALAQPVESSLVTGVAITFAGGDNTGMQTFNLRGNLVATSAGKSTVVPLRLNYSQPITATTAADANGGAIQAMQFDAAAWLNFASAGNAAAKLLANLSGSQCTETDSHSCAYYQDALARLIGERISKSLSIKTKPINQKAVSKGKIGG